MMQWRPMATAPKDGTRILLWDYAANRAVIGWWAEEKGTLGWRGDLRGNPTLWMPLPDRPDDPAGRWS